MMSYRRKHSVPERTRPRVKLCSRDLKKYISKYITVHYAKDIQGDIRSSEGQEFEGVHY